MHPERGVGADERHLKRSEVDDPRDLLLVECPLERREIGDVAPDQLDAGAVAAEHELEAAAIVAEVVADDGVAVVEHASGDPCAQAAERPGDEHALRQAARPGRR